MKITFRASPVVTNMRSEIAPWFSLVDASLRADLIEAISYHQRFLNRTPTSEIQRGFLADVTHLLQQVEASDGQTATFKGGSSYLSRRYSGQIAKGDFLTVQCGDCGAMLTASDVIYDSWKDAHAAGQTLFCTCGARLWLHFDVTPK
ncbi:hypothetical protein So717_33900 [Roseobacter cerasinus]|uniref:Uncharacterized protein n=1 Tax=Roseobacter cerasinus TaxID=2602289 RepID=A0A640VUV6_9RHOB|nr:hypothetical protein [Roseobacter cerasinus]GFE51637.1 hypothetical protein So717_33900 [Roseobacter cerasinus]